MTADRLMPLRLQLALAMIVCVLATVAIGYGGLTAFGEWQTQDIISHLSPEADRARIAIENGKTPAMGDLEALQRESPQIQAMIDDGQNWALLVLSLIAAGAGAVLGVILSARLGAPLAEVARAARSIAAGNLHERAVIASKGVGEITQLVRDFNLMAGSLESFERELNANAAAIAHELRTPLTVLRGYVQGAIDGVFTPDAAHLQLLLGQIEGLSRLVEDLRTLSLAESGKLSLFLQDVDLAVEAGVAIDALRQLFGADGMRIETALEPAPLSGDPVRLRQALVAVLENARRHASAGGFVRIETRTKDGRAIARIIDRGPGMGVEDLKRGFESFWRGDPSRTKETGGTGLGLSVVMAILKAHGGTASLTNSEEGGLCVELSFLALN